MFRLLIHANMLSRPRRRGIVALSACLAAFACGLSAATMPTPAAPAGPELDPKHLTALGMVETGNNDALVGRAGEVSRYQIHPSVWRAYSPSREYRNPRVSTRVAQLHWARLMRYFEEKTGRAPDDFDMYVMWNTRFGYYARRGFDRQRIAPVVQDRARRFTNLVESRG